MVNNVVTQYLKENKQGVSCDENILHISLMALCFAGLYPSEKICNAPRKSKLHLAYQITLYVLCCPIIFSQFVKLYLVYEDLQVAIETITHIVMGVGSYNILAFTNWN